MVEYLTLILSSMIGVVVVTAALMLVKKEDYAWIPAILLLLPDLYTNINYVIYPILVDVVIIGNILSLKVLESSQYRGLDYALMSIIGLVTSYVLYTPISTGAVNLAVYFGFLLGLFMVVSVASYFIIQIGARPENLDAAVKAIVRLCNSHGTILHGFSDTAVLIHHRGILVAIIHTWLHIGATWSYA